MSTTKPSVAALASGGTYPAGDASAMTGLPADYTFDIGQLYLMGARLDTPTTPNAGGTQVADEFDDATGIGSLGSATVASGYLSNPGGYTQYVASGSAFGAGVVNYGTTATAFDGTLSTRAQTACACGNTSMYVGKAFSAPQAISQAIVWNSNNCGFGGSSTPGTINIYIYGKNSAPANATDGTLMGSSGAFTDIVTGTSKTIACTGTYQYVWVYVTGGSSGVSTVSQMEYFTTAAPSNITTVSNAYTASSAPTTVSFVVEYQDVSTTAVLNTDIIVSASRDNGTTWTAVTLVDIGPSPITGARVLKGTATVSGQPSGTSVKWKVATANTKEQRVHGIWMQWK